MVAYTDLLSNLTWMYINSITILQKSCSTYLHGLTHGIAFWGSVKWILHQNNSRIPSHLSLHSCIAPRYVTNNLLHEKSKNQNHQRHHFWGYMLHTKFLPGNTSSRLNRLWPRDLLNYRCLNLTNLSFMFRWQILWVLIIAQHLQNITHHYIIKYLLRKCHWLPSTFPIIYTKNKIGTQQFFNKLIFYIYNILFE